MATLDELLAEAERRGLEVTIQAPQPQRPALGERIVDNLIGLDNDYMSAGEKAAQALNNAAEGMSFGLVGDEANARFDDLIGRGNYEDRVQFYRDNENQFQEENPVLSFGSRFAGALAVPGAAGLRVLQAGSLPTRLVSGAALGAGAGATEGYMDPAEGSTRGQSAMFGGIAGGALGAAAEPLARSARAAWESLAPIGAASRARQQVRNLGLDDASARVLAAAVEADAPTAQQQFQRAGQNAVVAMAGRNTRGLSDLVANSPGRGAGLMTSQLEDMTSAASRQFDEALDRYVGPGGGVSRVQREIMSQTAPERRAAYEAAYAAVPDYGNAAGRNVLTGLARVDRSALNRANSFLRTRGLPELTSAQLDGLQRVARAGTPRDRAQAITDLVDQAGGPTVEQVDAITRVLQDRTDPLAGFGRQTSGAYGDLATEIRRNLDEVAPEYATARASGQDAIANREAVKLGEQVFDNTPVDVVEDAAAEFGEIGSPLRRYAAQGLRSTLNERMGRARSIISDPSARSEDVREALRGLREVMSPNSRAKVRAVLGDDAADQLYREVDEVFQVMTMRDSTATGSDTQPRRMFQEMLDQYTPQSVGEAVSEGGLTAGVQNLLAPILDDPKMMRAARQEEVRERIARLLMQSPREVMPQLNNLGPALRAGDDASEYVGNLIRRSVMAGAATPSASLPF